MPIIQKIGDKQARAGAIFGTLNTVLGIQKIRAQAGYINAGGIKEQVFGTEGIPLGLIGFSLENVSGGWSWCNGLNTTPDLVGNSPYNFGYFLRGSNRYAAGTTFTAHDHGSYSGSTGVNSVRVGSPGLFDGTKSGNHSHSMNHTHASVSHLPLYVYAIPFMNRGFADEIPNGLGIFWPDSNTVPAGWDNIGGIDSVGERFIWPSGSDNAGNTGGATTHTHSWSGYTGYMGASTQSGNGYSATNQGIHRHSMTHTHGYADHQPPWIDVMCITPLEPTSVIPIGAIAFFGYDQVPYGWELWIPGQGRFLRMNSLANGSTGGSETHDHGSYPGSSGSTSGGGCANDAGTNGTSYAACIHTHTITHSHPSGTNIPRNKELLICQKVA